MTPSVFPCRREKYGKKFAAYATHRQNTHDQQYVTCLCGAPGREIAGKFFSLPRAWQGNGREKPDLPILPPAMLALEHNDRS
jgi:hypothetical protein